MHRFRRPFEGVGVLGAGAELASFLLIAQRDVLS